ncbi:MAG: NRDE family protein [Balneolaceae bacterium]|nr:MAG: NRDE family protein [Balneolaceae bacterium]
MCLIVFAIQAHPDYPFILAGNRDEFYNRPAESAAFWDTEPEILAGKDAKAGGTWLGVSETGRIAALTNFRDMFSIKEHAPSRGDIVKDVLTTPDSVPDFLEQLMDTAQNYNGFNLLAGTPDEFYYYSSVKNSYQKLPPGVYSISNAHLESNWPKSDWAEKEFRKILTTDAGHNDLYFEILKNTTTYPTGILPQTGLPEQLEIAVSAVFIKTDNYGTRCSSLIRRSADGSIYFEERTYSPGDSSVVNRSVHTLT